MTAVELISTNVATGLVYERLSEVAFRIAATRSHYCVVLGDDGWSCMGVIRLADIAERTNPGNRILGDLIGQITPLTVRSTEPAAGIAALFAQHGLGAAIVVGPENRYVGLITSESVLAWTVKELQLKADAADSVSDQVTPSPGGVRYLPGSAGEVPRPNRLLLVVEDHVESRNALLLILRRRNYGVIETDSVKKALSLACQHKFDLVISDIELPDGSGLGLMKELRQRHGLKGIAVTGLSTDADRTRSQAAGFSYHLKKPVNIRDLEAAIAAVLAASSGVAS